jgi:hypothetical protein
MKNGKIDRIVSTTGIIYLLRYISERVWANSPEALPTLAEDKYLQKYL